MNQIEKHKTILIDVLVATLGYLAMDMDAAGGDGLAELNRIALLAEKAYLRANDDFCGADDADA